MTIALQPAPLAATAAALRAGTLALDTYLAELCDRIDAAEPEVQALLPEPERRARLLAEAAALQARYPTPAGRPPLFGIPIGVKDIFRADGFATRAGSTLPPELFAGPEAAVVTQLRAAGALVLGKTVTTEFAAMEPGPTHNPHNPAHTPGGSSSGSAAAVAAGFCPLALGSQTIGSVIRPAAFCGVVGYKPTFGRITTAGVIPYSQSVDHVGLFTQDVAGMRLTASLVCHNWHADDDSDPVQPVLGIPAGPYLAQAEPEAQAAFASQAERLAAAGYTVRRVPVPAFAAIATLNERHRRLAAAELAAVHAEWFTRYADRYRPRTAAIIREGQSVGADELAAGRASRNLLRTALEDTRQAAGVDLWLSPPAPGPAPPGLNATGDPIMNVPWTHTGLPQVTVPAGRAANGLPLGLSFIAAPDADERLLTWSESLAATVASVE
jgi:Asp-tRNA(Asn)/Glu-tRNA(Gln) amidotransferase A subunit family amidase